MNIEKRLVKETFLNFVWPTMASTLTLSVLSMTDMMIAGHLIGDVGLAAVGLTLPVIFTVNLVKVLLGMGGSIVFSEKMGRGDFAECSRAFTLSAVGSLIAGILLGGLGLCFLRPLSLLLGATGTVIMPLQQYMGVLLFGMPVMILSPVLVIYLRNDSKQNYAMACVIFSSILNVVLSILLGKRLGMYGIAAGTIIAETVSCVLSGGMLLCKRRPYGLTKDFFSPELLKKVLRLGSPIALICLYQIVLTVVINQLLSTEAGDAAYGVVKYLINFLFAFFNGITGAMQPMLGIYLGEREKSNIRHTAACGFRGVMLMALITCVMLNFCGGFFCTVFGVKDPEVRILAVDALRIIGFYAFSAGVVAFLNEFHRCMGKDRICREIVLMDNLIMPGLGLLLFVGILDLGSMGIFYAIGLSAVGTLLYYWLRFRPFGASVTEEGKKTCLGGFWSFLKEWKGTDEEAGYHEIAEATPENISRITEEVMAYCKEQHLEEKKQFYIRLSIEELLTNVAGIAKTSGRKHKHYFADVLLLCQPDGSVSLRIRDNLTEWTPAALDIHSETYEKQLEEEGVNKLGFGIIRKIAKDYCYKRTIGLNNFSVVL